MADVETPSNTDWEFIDIYTPDGRFMQRVSRELFEESVEINAAFTAYLDNALAEHESRHP